MINPIRTWKYLFKFTTWFCINFYDSSWLIKRCNTKRKKAMMEMTWSIWLAQPILSAINFPITVDLSTPKQLSTVSEREARGMQPGTRCDSYVRRPHVSQCLSRATLIRHGLVRNLRSWHKCSEARRRRQRRLIGVETFSRSKINSLKSFYELPMRYECMMSVARRTGEAR